jgi:hypothetical protein
MHPVIAVKCIRLKLKNYVKNDFNLLILTGKKSLWEAQGLNSFLHSSVSPCKGKVIGRTLYVNEWFVDVLHSFS